MFRLTTLGAIDLRDGHGHPVRDVVAQPKRVALLAYLAVEGRRGPIARDRLLSLFWPESDEARARNALSQALHHLRHALGREAIASSGAGPLELHPDGVWCDAAAFAEAIERGQPELALDLYRGEFCPGLYVAGAPGVERWLDVERARLRSLVLAASVTLARQLMARGDGGGAARVTKRALAIGQDDEDSVRTLLVLLERAGDPAGAVAAYQAHVARLATELEVEPSKELRQVGEELRARASAAGVAASEWWGPVPTGVAPRERPAAAPAVRRRRWLVPLAVAGAATVLLFAILGPVRSRLGRARAVPRSNRDLLVVAPFHVATGDSALAFLGEGMVDLLSYQLAGAGRLRAVDPRSVFAAWREGTTGATGADQDLALARRLGAGWLAVGAALGSRHQLVVTVSLVDVASGGARAEVREAGTLDSLPALVDALSLRLLPTLAAEPPQRTVALSHTPLPALRAYLEGRSAYRAGRFEEAVRRLREAVALDSTFAVAALELAYEAEFTSEGRGPFLPRVWALRDRLSPGDQTLLVAIAGPRYPARSSMAELTDAWQRATRAAPEAPAAWYDYGDFLFHAGAATRRDTGFVLAEAALRRAVELDSSDVRALVHLTQIATRRGEVASARRLGALVFARDSTSEQAQFLRWRLAVASGDSATAGRIEGALDTLSLGTVRRLVDWSQADGVSPGIALRALEVFQRRAATAEDAQYGTRLLVTATTNAGRFGPWSAYGRRTNPRTSDEDLAAAAYNWFDGPRSAAPDVGARGNADTRWLLMLADCERGRPAGCAGLPAVSATLMRRPPSVMRDIVQALTAAALRRPEAESLLRRLDGARDMQLDYGQLAIRSVVEGRGYALLGQSARALDALRRRPYATAEANSYLAASLHLEGRLAAQLGDTAGAIRAYRHYLALRPDPDPGARPIVDSVRTELARLEIRRR